MTVSFTIPGEPVGKGRPRGTNTGKGVRMYTPAKTISYENLVKLEYERQCRGHRFGDGEELCIRVEAFFPIPKSAGKKKTELMKAHRINPTRKPDADNILKIVADSLNGVAYRDDSQIVYATVSKQYHENPRVIVAVYTLPGL